MMDYLVDKLIRETARFIEICQVQTFKGKLNAEEYSSLTGTKFEFIQNVLEYEKDNIFIDKDFDRRINKLFLDDYFLCESNKKIVGK